MRVVNNDSNTWSMVFACWHMVLLTATVLVGTRYGSCVPRTLHLLSASTGCKCLAMVIANDFRFHRATSSSRILTDLSGDLRCSFGSLRSHSRTVVGPTEKISQSPAFARFVSLKTNSKIKKPNLEYSKILFS